MRYRALARTGQAVSSLTLRMTDKTPPEARIPLLDTALEAGINSFDIGGADASLLDAVAAVLSPVDRRLLFVSIRLGPGRTRSGEAVRDFSAERLTRVVEACAVRMKLGHLDLALLDDPASDELPTETLAALKALRQQGRATFLGIAGEGETMDAYLSVNAFDVLLTSYNLISPWQVRNRLRRAVNENMSVFGIDPFPETLRRKPGALAAPSGFIGRLFGRKPRDAVNPTSGYGFLDQTDGWTAEEVCIAYALTEPGLSSVVVSAHDPEHLAALAAVPERELPSNLPAQIEMARFSVAA